MKNNPLQEFLENSSLATDMTSVAALQKTSLSNNITYQEWSTLVNALCELILRFNEIYPALNITSELLTGETGDIPIRTGSGERSIVFNSGDANGVSSIAGGVTEIALVKAVLGKGYASLIEKYGSVSNIPDSVLNFILEYADIAYTAAELKRMLQLNPSVAENLLSISLGTSSYSQSAGATSLGFGNISGAKGYYITEIDVESKTVTLSTTQDTTSAPQYEISWEVGDRLYIVNDNTYWVEISKVDGNVVTLTSMPFSSLANLKSVTIPFDSTYDITNPTERTVLNLDKPTDGEVYIGWGAFSIGALNTILGSAAYGVGYRHLIAGAFGTAFGQENTVGYSAFAAGILCEALAKASVALCHETEAIGDFSFAQNNGTRSEGKGSHSQGYRSKAIGDYSDATGYKTTTVGKYSSSSGESTNRFTDAGVNGKSTIDEIITAWKKAKFSASKGQGAHSGGKDCLALGDYSSADGENTIAKANHSRSTGLWTEALGKHSYAGGDSSKAKHDDSFVHGRKLSTSRDCQAVFGEDNVDNPDALLIVGKNDYPNGNAFEVIEKDGMSSIKVGNTEITEEQLKSLLTLLK